MNWTKFHSTPCAMVLTETPESAAALCQADVPAMVYAPGLPVDWTGRRVLIAREHTPVRDADEIARQLRTLRAGEVVIGEVANYGELTPATVAAMLGDPRRVKTSEELYSFAAWMLETGWEFHPGGRTQVGVLYESYKAWCDRHELYCLICPKFPNALCAEYPHLRQARMHGNFACLHGIRRAPLL